MKLILPFFLLLHLSAFGQWIDGKCPDKEVVDMEYNGDTLILTVVEYEWSWTQTDFSYIRDCIEHISKEVYAVSLIRTIPGRVIDPTPKRYEFDDNYTLTPAEIPEHLYGSDIVPGPVIDSLLVDPGEIMIWIGIDGQKPEKTGDQ